MRIRTKKKMNLPELIRYVWDNEVFPSVWKSEGSPSDDWTIQFFEDGMFRSYNGFHDYDTFAVTVEEELTEDTGIPGATFVYYYTPGEEVKAFSYSENARPTINHMIKMHPENKPLAIYVGPTLIWSRESGIPESGVLEVDTE